MEKKWFVGIDVSKKTIDVVYYDRKRRKICEEIHRQFPNDQSGFKLMHKWFKECGMKSAALVIGLENTGIYSFDLSDSMRKIVRTAFPNANRVIGRFHIQKPACDAVQELRIKHRWDAIQQANDEVEEARLNGENYVPFRYSNRDTRKELLMHSRYLLLKSAEKWTDRQKQRAAYY